MTSRLLCVRRVSEEVYKIPTKMAPIEYKTAIDFLLPRHYSGRIPPISKAFGWYDNDCLKAVCTFGKPASPTLCSGICGSQFAKNVYELNRLCRTEDWGSPLSEFVSWCLRQLKQENWIIVSYSDTGMHHNGYIYQACNFIYTGQTKCRTDKFVDGNRHPRHYQDNEQGKFRRVRTAKNRYVYFCTNSRRTKKEWQQNLAYPILPYPKCENVNYVLGEYQKPIIISARDTPCEINTQTV